MTEITDADRAEAARVVGRWANIPEKHLAEKVQMFVELGVEIARALAEQREQLARRPAARIELTRPINGGEDDVAATITGRAREESFVTDLACEVSRLMHTDVTRVELTVDWKGIY